MGKYKAAGGEDTRGAKSKAQKAEARNEKDLKTKAEKERLADQSWQKVRIYKPSLLLLSGASAFMIGVESMFL